MPSVGDFSRRALIFFASPRRHGTAAVVTDRWIHFFSDAGYEAGVDAMRLTPSFSMVARASDDVGALPRAIRLRFAGPSFSPPPSR